MSDSSSPSPDPPSEHVHAPQQARSRKTLARLTGAALELFGEQGVEATTVGQIVERADSSVGSFYARFDGKEALVRHLEGRVWSRARERWERAMEEWAWEELSLEEVVRSLVHSLARLHDEDAAQRRALERHADRRGERDPEEAAFHRHVSRGVRELLLARSGEMGHPEPETAASVAYRWLLGGLRELLDDDPGPAATDRDVEGGPAHVEGGPDSPDRRPVDLDREAVVEELTRGLVAYLGGRDEGAGDQDVEFFDVWQ